MFLWEYCMCSFKNTYLFLINAYFILKYLSLFKRLFVLLYLNIYSCHCGLAGRENGIRYMMLFVKILMLYEKFAFSAPLHQTSFKRLTSCLFLKNKLKKKKILKTVLKKNVCLKVWLLLFEKYATGQKNQTKPGAHILTYKHIAVPMCACLCIYLHDIKT